ncbi:MAG: hypothetical protein KDI46_02230 [Alphaproteobacteria bacterium]|nr:hypothetical protein [Alphaproteobacteria bacterium]
MSIVAFRNTDKANNIKNITIREVVPGGFPGATPARAIINLTTISRKKFAELGGEVAIKAAFENTVDAIRNGGNLPPASDPLQRLANTSVTRHAEELRAAYGN